MKTWLHKELIQSSNTASNYTRSSLISGIAKSSRGGNGWPLCIMYCLCVDTLSWQQPCAIQKGQIKITLCEGVAISTGKVQWLSYVKANLHGLFCEISGNFLTTASLHQPAESFFSVLCTNPSSLSPYNFSGLHGVLQLKTCK